MRDHLRALLITLHLAAVAFMALPAPGGFMLEREWKQRAVQDTFASIAGTLRGLGLSTTRQDVHDTLWDLGMGWKGVRRTGAGWVSPYMRYCGVNQGWSMFAHVPPRSGRLEVYLEEGGEWRPIHLAQDPAHDWRGPELRQERLRAYLSDFAWRRRKGRFPDLVEAMALRASDDFPEATRLRGAMVEVSMPEPAVLRELGAVPLGEAYFEHTVDLSDYRFDADATETSP